MLQIKILGQTPKGGRTLCATCKSASRVLGQNCEEIIFCSYFRETKFQGVVPFKVAECGSYHPTNVPWLHEMEAIAWSVEARRKGPVGFSDPARDGEMEIVIKKPRSYNSDSPAIAE